MHLLPAEEVDDPLGCHIVETTLEDGLGYRAISYVWGDEADPSTIFCQGAQYPITRNLNAALRRIRRESESLTLWVDRPCIRECYPY